MPAFTVKDALTIIDAEIARLEARWPDATTFASGNEIHAARMALLNAKNAILVGQIKGTAEVRTLAGVESTGERAARHRSELAGADLPPFPAYQCTATQNSTANGPQVRCEAAEGHEGLHFSHPVNAGGTHKWS